MGEVFESGYDALGAQTSVSVGNQVLSTNVYEPGRAHKLEKTQFGNGQQIRFAYVDFDRIVGTSYGTADSKTDPRYLYLYGANGRVSHVLDRHLNRTHQSEYDLAERPCQATTRDQAGSIPYRATLVYDKLNRLSKFKESARGTKHETAYTYDNDNRTTKMQFGADARKVEYSYDKLGRTSGRKLTNGTNVSTASYTFAAGDPQSANSTTSQIQSITQPGLTLSYT